MPSQRNWPVACIIAGMAQLAIGCVWPGWPMVSAMGLVTLGATTLTAERFRQSPMLLQTVVLHLSVYVAIYGIFVAATLHAAHSRSGPRLEVLTILDIVLSVVPMLAAGRMAWAICESAGDA